MNITEEITKLRVIYDFQFDENLYVALTLALLTSRHLIVTTSNLQETLNETIQTINTIWGIPASVISFDQNYKYTEQEVQEFFISGNEKLSPVYIVLGVEKLPIILQKVILKIMKGKCLEIVGNKTYLANEKLFSFISICDNDDIRGFYWYLKSEFWFKQHHTIQINTNDCSTKRSPFSENDVIIRNKWNQMYNLRPQVCQITILPELKRYIYDLIIHVRTHRVTHGGLPTKSIADLTYLTQSLTLIFKNSTFVVPTMIKLAFRKYIPCHLRIIEKAEWEPSIRWGGDLKVAEELIRRVTPEHVVEHVLRKVSVPI